MVAIRIIIISIFFITSSNLYASASSQPPPYQYSYQFKFPEQERFEHLRNIYLANLFEPQHRVQDTLANPGQQINIIGKFEYDCVLHKDLEDEIIHAYLYP